MQGYVKYTLFQVFIGFIILVVFESFSAFMLFSLLLILFYIKHYGEILFKHSKLTAFTDAVHLTAITGKLKISSDEIAIAGQEVRHKMGEEAYQQLEEDLKSIIK